MVQHIAPDFRTRGKRILVMVMSDPRQILEKMSDALESICPEGEWQLSSALKNSRKCDIFLVTNPRVAKKLALKIYKAGTASEQAPGLQFRALDRLQNADPKVLAPQAYCFLPDKRAILMEWIDAETVQSILWRWTFLSAKRRQTVKDTGSWLRQFHEVSHIADQPLEGEKLTQKLVAQCSKHNASAASPAIKQSIELFEKAASALKVSTPHALLHGDFTTRNILLQDGKPIGVDIWGARMGSVFEDAARFVTYAAINSPFSLAASPWHPDGALLQSFASGYGKDLIDPHSREWTLLLWYQFLRRWIVYSGRPASGMPLNVGRWQTNRAKAGSLMLQSWLEDCF